jgi:RHS repeat-associated protein
VVVDHQGSAALSVDRCGRRIAQLATNPWGLDVFDATQNPERHRYTGHLRDINAPGRAWDDFDQMHARTYFPYAARFLSPDPGRDYDLSHPQSFNLYAYVRNNPVTLVDPWGLESANSPTAPRRNCDPDGRGNVECQGDQAFARDRAQASAQTEALASDRGRQPSPEHLAALPKSTNADAPPNQPKDWEPASWQSGLGQPWDWIAQNTDVSVGLDFGALNLSRAADSRRVSKASNFSLFAVGFDASLTFGSDRRRAAANHLVGVTYGIPPIVPPASLYGFTFTLYLDDGSLVGLSINFGFGAFIQPKLTDYRKWR